MHKRQQQQHQSTCVCFKCVFNVFPMRFHLMSNNFVSELFQLHMCTCVCLNAFSKCQMLYYIYKKRVIRIWKFKRSFSYQKQKTKKKRNENEPSKCYQFVMNEIVLAFKVITKQSGSPKTHSIALHWYVREWFGIAFDVVHRFFFHRSFSHSLHWNQKIAYIKRKEYQCKMIALKCKTQSTLRKTSALVHSSIAKKE